MQSKKSKLSNGFTLVELIIVVTILGILSTISFVSFQSYSKNARDSNRLETMSIVQKGISLNQVTTSKTLLPDDYTQVLASGSLLGYEGIVGESVSRGIQMSSIPKDPIRGDNYIYYTNKDRNKVQVMGFMEGQDLAYIGLDKVYADGTGSKIPKVTGDKLGIILDGNNNRVTGTGIDLLLSNSGTIYTTYFSNTDNLTSSGKDLYSKVYNRREDLLKDTSLASLDDSLVGYWDMETTTLSGGVTVLKDLSKYHNDGTLSGGVIVGGTNGIKGKATYFDGVDDIFIVNDDNSLDFAIDKGFSISTLINSQDLLGSRDFIIEKGYDDVSQGRIGFWLETWSVNGGLRGGIGNWNAGSVGYELLGDTNERNKFVNFTMVVNYYDNTIKMYNNGNIFYEVKNINPLLVSNNVKMCIGCEFNGFGAGAHFFKGIIDDIRIYNRPLSYSEIKELYNGSK